MPSFPLQTCITALGATLQIHAGSYLGRILLGAIRGANDGTSRFVVPVGSEEVHVEMSLKPLNPHIGPDDPLVLNLVEQLACAAEKVRNGRRLEPSCTGPIGTVQNERSLHDA